jgi:hypothetical protein
MKAKQDTKDFPEADFGGSTSKDEPVNDEPMNDAVNEDGAAVNDQPVQFAESAVPDEKAQARYEPLAPVVALDPVKLNEVANEDAQQAAPGADDPNGPVVSFSWSGLQTHDFGGVPFARAAVVTVDLEKEKLAAKQAAEAR